jgi:penicillin-binding protein 1A
VNSVLSGVLIKGTGASANIGRVAAGKTGTTTDSKDAWFVGYTCTLTAAVWMGHEQPQAMEEFKGEEVSGGTWPARIWHDFMSEATEDDETECEFPTTDAGERLVNQNLEWARTTTTVPSKRSTTTTSSPDADTSSTVPRSSTSTTAPPRSTTTAPAPTTTTTAAPPTTAPAVGGQASGQG